MKRCFRTIGILAISFLPLVSCEEVDDDIDRHTSASDSARVQLDHVAEILAAVPLQQEHLNEVHKAAVSSAGNGYDEEYTMRNLFEAPGCGVGDPRTKSIGAGEDQVLLKDLIEQHVRRNSTKSAAGVNDPDRFLEALSASDIQIYWPFSENWDGRTLPVITFDPEDDSDANIGYRLFQGDDGTRRVEEVITCFPDI